MMTANGMAIGDTSSSIPTANITAHAFSLTSLSCWIAEQTYNCFPVLVQVVIFHLGGVNSSSDRY
jgi:hypothetical protein